MTAYPASSAGVAWAVSLPQDDGFLQQEERRAQLALFQQG
jgi:hypothetical protein